jgi:hypothetical protein
MDEGVIRQLLVDNNGEVQEVVEYLLSNSAEKEGMVHELRLALIVWRAIEVHRPRSDTDVRDACRQWQRRQHRTGKANR